MNNVVLIGRLTKDPEIKNITEKNLLICNFVIAVDRIASKGEKTVDFIKIACFGKKAELCKNYFTKGMKVSVIGKIQIENYEDKNGIKRYDVKILAQDLHMLDKPMEKIV